MDKQKLWLAEALWWLITIVVVCLVLLPILLAKIEYPYLIMNIYFIVATVLFSRWLFLWKFVPYAWSKWFKLVLIFTLIPLVFMFMSNLNVFEVFLDEIGMQELVKELPMYQQDPLAIYIRNQMIFFGTASIISGFLIPFKMIWSLWKQYNRNEV